MLSLCLSVTLEVTNTGSLVASTDTPTEPASGARDDTMSATVDTETDAVFSTVGDDVT